LTGGKAGDEMFNFKRCHVIQFPSGRWGFVGSVPIELHRHVTPASQDAIMGGRCIWGPSGPIELKPMTFDTEAEAESALDHWAD
ncbi:MAG: hypothetical protein ACXAEN_27460, partial [Candidatus Thorarchaeota archaeon]